MKNPKALLGVSVLCLALALFGIILARLDNAKAQYDPSFNNFYYQGIDNVTENVYSINFGDRNTMFVTGGDEGTFYMSTIPVVINELRSERNGVYLGVSNILGGDNIRIGKSNNITVIGGEGLFGNDKAVDDYNDNATFLGGSENSILGGTSSDTPTVLLGGMKNRVEPEHNANAIVGGYSNTINKGAENVNILGGTSISIDGNDVIAGGQGVNGVVSDSFVFNDGDSAVDLDGSGMFFLGVTNGVGFGTGTKERHQGAISNGAVKLGSIDIQSVECTSENVGVMGLWNGCMVGCTSGSAMRSKWEMLGYGSLCEQICKNSDKCIAQALDTIPDEYQSFCITGSVDITNTVMCTGARLDLYYNVIFEAYLLDSGEDCPERLVNQCVFRCNDHSHLTGDKTGKMDGDTKCFNDCPLPWSGSQYRGHNAMITGYSVTGANCSDGDSHRDTCAAYRKPLMCVNGTWYEMENGEVTDTENTDYIYETCTLNEYSCDTSADAFNLSRKDIVNGKEDFIPSIWAYSAVAGNSNSYLMDFLGGNIVPGHIFDYGDISWTNDNMPQLEGSTQVGIRGTYKLCIDFAPEMPGNQAPQNERVCQEAGDLPGQYHYKFIGCNTGNGFRMAEDGVCRKQCEYNGQLIEHGSGIALYTGASAICPDTCNKKEFQCYDGILYADLNLGTNGKFVSGTALDSNIYNYTGCTLTGAVCDSGYYNIDEATYQSMKDIGIFSSCQSSWVFNNQCTTGNRYHLDACNEGYYMSGNMCVPVVNNAEFFDLDVYFLTNEGVKTSTLMDRNLGATAYMGEPGKSTGDWYGDYYQWGNNYGFPNYGDVDITTEKADVLGYGPSEYSRNTYYVGGGYWFMEANSYGWLNLWGQTTDSLVARQGPCPDEYHVPTADEFVNLVYDWGEYGYNINRNEYCLSSGTPSGFLYGTAWSSDLLMPFGGNRWPDSSIRGQGQFGYLQTSSIWMEGTNGSLIHFPYLYYSILGDCVTIIDGALNGDKYGKPVRCMKNSPNQLLTIDSKEGTGALIILHGNEITKLGTPHKGSETFGGWYWDEGYTSKAKTGDTVSAPAYLYAKWVSNECTGTLPSGNGVLTGFITYPNGYTTTGWTYKANGELGACEWRCADGYIQGSNNTCVDNFCANNHSDFKDLDMYFIINPTSIGHYTFMDRNLGATAYMGQPGKSSGDWYGCYYQWGNNYGFKNQGTVKTKHQMVDTSVYSWSNPYLSDTFTINHSSPYDWSSQKNDNLWGDTTDTLEARQGPCPEGYHVPTRGEFVSVVDNYRKKSANYTSSNMMMQRGLDTLMPFAGYRSSSSAGIGSQGSDGIYWSSSSYNYSYSYLLTLLSYDNTIGTATAERRSVGYSVRCLKNSVNQLLTIDSNGGTGAMIIVHGNEITKLGTPHKGNMIFEGWYSDSSFTPSSKVITGNTVSAGTHLYAKWGCDEGYIEENGMCVLAPLPDFEDLDMYFLSNGGATGHYTLMDRNLGATAYMDEPGKSTGDWYGNYYQWGNNYGFPNVGPVNKSTTKVNNASQYGPSPKNYYSSSTFIIDSSSNSLSDWANPSNNNLRGDVTNTLAARQGPCPTNYHVPTKNEFENVKNYWLNSVDNKKGTQRSLDSLMPFAGSRSVSNANVEYPGVNARYWSSSPMSSSQGCGKCAYLLSSWNGENGGFTVRDRDRANGFSVRCFKNSPNNNMVIYPNGGKKALIIVHGNEITKLGTPHKGNMVFEGWYSDQSFIPSSQVRTGDTVSDGTHLYAKWGCAEGYVQSGNNCVVVYNCGGETPDGINMSRGNFESYSPKEWTYQAEGELGACEWRCHEGYVQSGNTCVEVNYQCVSEDPILNSEYVVQKVGILSTSIGNVEKQLFASEEDIPAGQACAYVCNEAEGYHYFADYGGICAKCEEGTENYVNGQLVCTKVIDVCSDTNRVYVPEEHVCRAYGHCIRQRNWRTENADSLSISHSNMLEWNLTRPIGEDVLWECKSSAALLEENKCQYACETGYVCPYIAPGTSYGTTRVGCEIPSCPTSSLSNWNSNHGAVLVQNPQIAELNRVYVSATSETDFYTQVEDLYGCYFWCPSELYCNTKKKCYLTVEARNSDCNSSSSSYRCRGSSILKGNVVKNHTAYGENRWLESYENPGDYLNYLDSGCYEGCRESTTLYIRSNGDKVCWNKCPDDKYFSDNGGCKSCSSFLKMPDPDQNNWERGNPVSCVDKCDYSVETLCTDSNGCSPERCILTDVPAGYCPDGYETEHVSLNQIRCYRSIVE